MRRKKKKPTRSCRVCSGALVPPIRHELCNACSQAVGRLTALGKRGLRDYAAKLEISLRRVDFVRGTGTAAAL